jgi:hypothetical protein
MLWKELLGLHARGRHSRKLPWRLRGRLLAQMSMPGGKSMMYAVVGPTPGISENTTLLRDSKEVC